MTTHRRVLWGEGLFLRPQHFQRQDTYHDARLRQASADLHPYAWGLKRINVDGDALSNGTFRLNQLALVFPDGETYDAPNPEALPQPITLGNLPDSTQSTTVYATIAPLHEHNSNLGLPTGDAKGGLHRFVKDEHNTPDLFTDAESAAIAFLGKSVQLLTEDAPREEFVSLPIARIERASTGGFQLDATFVPPVLSIDCSDVLVQRLRQLLDALQAKVDALYGHHREPAKNLVEFRSGDIASFWLLHTASSAFAQLSHYLHNPRLYPERLFERLLQLAGELMTFSTQYALNDLPAYSHDEPGPAFGQLHQIIRDLLEAVISEQYFHIPLSEHKPSYHSGQFNSDLIDEQTEFYLCVGADLPLAELVQTVPIRFKVGSPDDVEKCVLSALPGIKLTHTPQVPAAVPVRAGQTYFSLSTSGALYQRMIKSGSVTIYVPSGIRELKLDLVAVTG